MMNPTFTFALLAVLGILLVWIAVVDIKTFTIADGINIAIALMAPLFWWASGVGLWPDAAIRVGVAIGVFVLFALMFHVGAMGGGDVKLAGALALWFTPYETLQMLVMMSLAGGALTIIVLAETKIRKKEGRPEVPYGVAIAFGGLWLLAQRFLNHFA
ncbi:A24 family peptidase [Sphingomonas jaspsi]|jgi:prepilin peptidase CpaA|uniref:A24 family peptidase n=1 Tax=Sphingomonas jaspsi TaxID=392409 RepID=UPI000562A44F|nr:prepilin peptidase [Sphingomonas jaspsi]